MASTGEFRLHRARLTQRVCQVGEFGRGTARQCIAERLQRGREGFHRGSPPDEQFGRPAIHSRMRLGEIVAGVLFEDGVEVGAAEAEGADAGDAWLRAAVDPRPRLGVEVKRTVLEFRLAVGLLDQERRQHLVMQGQRRVDQARQCPRRTWCGRSSTLRSR